MKTDNIHLTIVSPEKTLFDGMVRYVELPGSAGSFSIMYGHAPLISSLNEGNVKFKSEGIRHSIPIRGGFIEVSNDTVSVCTTDA